MSYAKQARATAETLTPGLLDRLSEVEFAQREAATGPGMDWFRSHGAGHLLLPRDFGGLAASPRDAVRFQFALGGVAPGVAVGTTMHHYKVVMIEQLLEGAARTRMLEGFGERRYLVASCGAESATDKSMFKPSVTVQVLPEGVRVTGAKRPCSMTRSMDLLSTMISGPPDSRFAGQILNVLIPADDPGVSRHPFWGTPILAAAENGEVRFEDVLVPDAHIIRCGTPERPDPTMRLCFVWFELLITAAYLGIASALTERALARERVSESLRARLIYDLEHSASALEGAAAGVAEGPIDEALLAKTLHVRYGVQDAIDRLSSVAFEALGGTEFQRDGEIAYRMAACRCLAFHPPQRDAMAGALARYHAGLPLELV
jgi:alkylation response protein AidB-like acyl-CoA dehydrogenase